MIEVKNNQLVMKGQVKDVIEEMKELSEIYGNITIEELITKLNEKWK